MTDFMDDILDATGIAHSYGFVAGKLPALPYIAYDYPKSIIKAPDDLTSSVRTAEISVNVELLTLGKNFATEAAVEDVLPSSEITRTEIYIQDENLYSITYEFTVFKKYRI